MAYQGQENFDHRQPRKTGVLITNLGTPDAPETGALRRYLREAGSDPGPGPTLPTGRGGGASFATDGRRIPPGDRWPSLL